MEVSGNRDKKFDKSIIDNLLLVLWFGSLWGAVEALIGGLLHTLLPPTIPGKIMIVLATGMMAWSFKKTGKFWIPVAIALVAAPLKLFSAVVFLLPVNAPAVLNPAFAILAQGVGFSLVCLVVTRIPAPKWGRYLAVGAGAGTIYSFVFVGIVSGVGLFVYPPMEVIKELGTKFPYWAQSTGGLINFARTSLPYSTIMAGIGATLVGLLPVNMYPRTDKKILVSGSVLWLTIFFVSSWLI
ncbi:MAG: hypothetical protein ACOC88_02050 [Candidatus Bipolaricaulota bacterium]